MLHKSLSLLTLLTIAAHAQTTGEIRGIVRDPSGAAVANSKLTLTSTETGESRSLASDGEGRYAFTLLKIGGYRVEVEAAGFRKTIATAGVRSAEITSLDLQLELGQVTEQVVISDAASKLDTQNAQIQESFETKKIDEIPVGRNPNNLAATLPGIIPAPGGFNTGSFVTNGNRVRANNITIDNITATDVSLGGTGSSNNGPLNFSSLKEVKIITNGLSAEFGRNSGAQVQYITKSGTNDFHGEAYEYLRNNVFNSRDFFDRTGKSTVTRYNQFGGVFGGPIIRNKTHFFVGAELNPLRGLGGSRSAQVPTAAMLAQVTDPTSKKLLDQYQLPAAATDQGTFGTVQQTAPDFNDFHQYSARVDHQIGARDTIFGRYGFAKNEGTGPSNTFQDTDLTNFGLVSTNSIYSINLNETHVFSGSVINEMRAGFGRTSPYFSLLTTVPLGPKIIFANAQVSRFGHSDLAPQGRVQNTYQIGDSLSWVRGAHNFKFGGDFFRYQLNSSLDSRIRGAFTFLNWDDFAAGRPTSYEQRFGSSLRGNRTWLQSAFAQDDYRITRTVTLNLGFRAEIYGPISEVNGFSSNLDFACREPMGIAGTGPMGCIVTGQPSTGTNAYYQPRVGFAWNPRGGKFVIRGGYGLVADFNYMNPITNQRSLPPLIITKNITGVTNFTGANSWANLVAGTGLAQTEGRSQVGRISTDVLNYSDFSPAIDPGLDNPQVHQWNFGVQRELPDGLVVKLSYVGTKGNYLQRTRPINLNANVPRPATNLTEELARAQEFVSSYAAMQGSSRVRSGRYDGRFNAVNLYDNSANSNFHAMEFIATRPFRAGYSIQAAYTFGKSIDDISDGLSTIPNDSANTMDPNNLRGNRGPSGFDVRQRWVITHVWEPQWGKRVANRAVRRFVDGWGFSGISSWRSGFPVSLDSGARLGVLNISTVTTGGVMRPNAAGPFEFNPQPAGSAGAPQGVNNDPVAGRRIATYAESLGLSQPLLGNFGTLGRSSHRLNGVTNFDWNVYKSIAITERVGMKIRCEMYNTFNNTAFRDVNRNISNPGFGQYTTTDIRQRVLQLGAVVQF